MQQTIFLIFILVLFLEAKRLGFTANHLDAFIFSRPGIPSTFLITPSFFFYCSHSNFHYFTLLTPSTLLPPPTHNWGPTHLSILYILHIHLPIPHLYHHRTRVLQLSISLYIFLSSSSPDLLADSLNEGEGGGGGGGVGFR